MEERRMRERDTEREYVGVMDRYMATPRVME
jgi:hypothetical protein